MRGGVPPSPEAVIARDSPILCAPCSENLESKTLRSSIRKGAFRPSAPPWLGYFMLLEDTPAAFEAAFFENRRQNSVFEISQCP